MNVTECMSKTDVLAYTVQLLYILQPPPPAAQDVWCKDACMPKIGRRYVPGQRYVETSCLDFWQ